MNQVNSKEVSSLANISKQRIGDISSFRLTTSQKLTLQPEARPVAKSLSTQKLKFRTSLRLQGNPQQKSSVNSQNKINFSQPNTGKRNPVELVTDSQGMKKVDSLFSGRHLYKSLLAMSKLSLKEVNKKSRLRCNPATFEWSTDCFEMRRVCYRGLKI